MGKAGLFLRGILAPASECALPFLSVNRAGFRPVARLTLRGSFRSALRAARTGIERYFQFYNRQSLDYRTASAMWMPQVFSVTSSLRFPGTFYGSSEWYQGFASPRQGVANREPVAPACRAANKLTCGAHPGKPEQLISGGLD